MIDQELKNALSDVMAGLPPEKLTFAFDPRLKEALSHVQKPGRYTGGEPGSVYKEKEKMDVRFAFCFPDTYEVGMSFLGEKILYELLNQHENWWCERAFMPWLDMKAEMERLGLPLYALESKDPLTAFDAVGFTLQYELSYTNILAMLDLAGIPLYAADRDERWPLIVAGGPCTCNAEPLAAFFDVIQLGEGERQLPSICAAIEQGKKEGISKQELLLRLRSVLRRVYREQLQVSRLGDTEIDWGKGTVRRGGAQTALTAKEFTLLKTLWDARGNIVTTDALCEALWDGPLVGYENTLMVHIRRLREKVEADPSHPRYLLTVRGLGYRLKREGER